MSPFRLILNISLLWLMKSTRTANAQCLNNNDFHVAGKRKLTCQYIRKDETRRQEKCKLAEVRAACPQACGLCCEDEKSFVFNSYDDKSRKCWWLSKKIRRQKLYCGTYNSGRMVKDACPFACNKCLTEVPVQTCIDNSLFRINKEDMKSCDWIGRLKDRRNRLCQNEAVKTNCPLACRTCCADDETYMFKAAQGKERKCAWLDEDISRRKRYCANLNKGALVENRCAVSCGRCSAGDTPAPTDSPTLSPTKRPSPTPSMSPSSTHTISQTPPQCELTVTLKFPAIDEALYGYHNDDFKIQKVNNTDVCGMEKYYNQTDWCDHTGDAFVWKDKNEETDFDNSREEIATIPSAAGNEFIITIQHYFVYYEYNYEYYNKDHTMAGGLTLDVNGEDMGVQFHHHVDEDVDTHTDREDMTKVEKYTNHTDEEDKMEVNPDYTDSLEVRVSCDESCNCVAEDN